MCMWLARGGVGREGGEWMRGLGLCFTNPVGTGVVLDVCLCLGCGKSGPFLGEGGFGTICTAVCIRCDSSTAYRN